MNIYNVFASVYDQIMGDWYFQQWEKYFGELIKKYKIKYDFVVDVGCGTGNVLLYFYKKGKRVMGIDQIPEMLEQAKRKIGKKKIKLMKMDMRNFKLDEPADLITCNYNALSELRNVRDLKRSFKSIYDNLKDNGWAIFDLLAIAYGREIDDSESESHISKSKKTFAILTQKWNEKRKIVNTYLYYFVEVKGSSYRLYKTKHDQKVYTLKALRRYIREAGFKKVFAYSWDDFLFPAKEYARKYIFVVKK